MGNNSKKPIKVYAEDSNPSDGSCDNILATPAAQTEKKITPKHAPKTPKGTRFRWADNDAIKTNPYKINEPAELALTLIDTKGKQHTFNCPQNPNWSSKEDILKSNTWYNQLVCRKLNRPNPDESRAMRYRPQWSKQEKEYLESLIKKKIRNTKRKPTGDDWEAISQEQNSRFLGQSVHPGQALAVNSEESKAKDPTKSQKRVVAKKELIIPHRTALALQGIVRKWPDTTTMINETLDVVGYYGPEQSGEEPDEEGTDGEVIEGGYKNEDGASDDGLPIVQTF